ncbi:hypothetical protein UFOVP836_47 [uncultured Caudovirales phage]|uniref:Uncharacterized protein n=1 Tax=uncultured Caudovirales phage TaxID=2100421 RepID=A0A6J5P9N1_9CAUD|nr:hypothetical protein UFOVP836_47 [uncultured Caudovirales phage]
MINPINPPIEVGWRGKLYPCDLTLGQLALVEGEAGIAIVYPAPSMLWQKPEAYQRGVLLYAMLKPHELPTATLAECMAAVVGDQREYFLVKLQKATDRLLPQLQQIWGVKEEAPSSPLAESSGGQNSGLPLVSTSDSMNETSGI